MLLLGVIDCLDQDFQHEEAQANGLLCYKAATWIIGYEDCEVGKRNSRLQASSSQQLSGL